MDDIKAEAIRLGFVFVGTTTPSLPPEPLTIYQDWLQGGCHAEMGYLATDRARRCRTDPSQLFEPTRSILVAAVQTPALTSLAECTIPFTGQIASYAIGADYHDWIPPRLNRLAAVIEQICGNSVKQRSYTDTGPLLERTLAHQAGLGWIGKNSCLIHPQAGSNLLLAELLLDIELETDPPFPADRCGTCQRCLLACPTGCIRPDRTVNAGRCLSYLTIENKGAIPMELRSSVGNHIFGCDICQQVCPWNRHTAVHPVDPGFATVQVLRAPDLRLEMRLTPQEFSHKYRGTPLMRAKRRGYLRNVAVALGNAHDADALPALQDALRMEPEPLIRAHAAWAISQIPSSQSADMLRRAISTEPDSDVQLELTHALSLL